MPVCPECLSAFLYQKSNPRDFQCAHCKRNFTLIDRSDLDEKSVPKTLGELLKKEGTKIVSIEVVNTTEEVSESG